MRTLSVCVSPMFAFSFKRRSITESKRIKAPSLRMTWNAEKTLEADPLRTREEKQLATQDKPMEEMRGKRKVTRR